MQKHYHRSEFWLITQGKDKITLNKNKFYKTAGEDIYIPAGTIHRVENLFTFYTAANNLNLNNLQNKPLAIKINDNEIYGDVRFMFPMLMGHQVWISIGNYDLDTHIDFLESYEKLNIEIIDKDSFKSAEYFDIPSNIWSLKGLTEAIKDGKRLCLASIS